jgi:hypothetical protein
MTKLFVLAALLIGCASAPPPLAPSFKLSILPPAVDVETLVPPAAVLEPVEVGTQFQTIPINGGRYCESAGGREACSTFLPGFVVSELVYAEAIRTRSDAGRLAAENTALRKLRAAERAAIARGEEAYQQRVAALELENTALRTPTVWERARPYAAFVLGAALATGVAAIVAGGSR